MEKNIERFYKTLNDFLFELEENFPNMKADIQKYSIKIEFKEEKDKIKYILKYFENGKKYKDFITNSNGEVFNDSENVELIPDINFTKIWNVKYKSDDDKEKIWKSIWKFLQVLYIISDLVNTMVNKTVDTKNEVDVNEMISNLQNSNDQNLDFSQLGEAQEVVKKMFDGDNVMGDLINDISKEVSNLDENNLMNLLGKDSDKLQNIIGSVGKTIDKKINEGSINQNDLLKSAKSMEKLVQENNPLMDMMKNVGKNMAGEGGVPDLTQMMSMLGNLQGPGN
jgi:hypothetical protein